MCGIVGYIGAGDTAEVLLDSLGSLEYRGYDSAGIALISDGNLKVIKSFGCVLNLKEKIPHRLFATAGIGHTRWATHGKPLEINAHPHQDCTGKIAVVHNGIVENYLELKDMLTGLGHRFVSDTDTEIISHLIEENYAGSTKSALQRTVRQLKGSFALAVINGDEPEKIFAARKESPLVIGVGKGQYFLASDATAFLKHTRKAIFLEDGDMAVLSKGGLELTGFEGQKVSRRRIDITWDVGAAEKSGYEHFMLKEIHEQPQSLQRAIAGRLNELGGEVALDGLSLDADRVKRVSRIVIEACGTSYHAGIIGKYAIEAISGIPTAVEIASEFRHSRAHLGPDIAVIALSQSGETADTIAAVRKASKDGAHVIAITNVAGSTISREATDTIYMRSGPEIGVAATKTFTAQVVILYILALYLGRALGRLSNGEARKIIASIKELPQKARRVIEIEHSVASMAALYKNAGAFYVIGRNLNYPIALEGALKLKETAYIFSEGLAAGELKHGPLALVTASMPVIAIATKSHTYDKMIGNIKEISARDAPVIAIANESDGSIGDLVKLTMRVPDSCEYTSPVLSSVALQLFAYYLALNRGCPIDKPRNLAKCVTVE